MAQAQKGRTPREQERYVSEAVDRVRRFTQVLQGPPVPQDQRTTRMNLNNEIERELRSGQLTPEQAERLRRVVDQMNGKFRQIESGQRPAPARVHVFDVTIGSGPGARTFRVTGLTEQPNARTLLIMAANHEFFEPSTGRVDVPGPAPRAAVEQLSGPGATEFNKGPQAARVDNFEVALNRARESTPAGGVPDIAIAAVTPQQGGQRGG